MTKVTTGMVGLFASALRAKGHKVDGGAYAPHYSEGNDLMAKYIGLSKTKITPVYDDNVTPIYMQSNLIDHFDTYKLKGKIWFIAHPNCQVSDILDDYNKLPKGYELFFVGSSWYSPRSTCVIIKEIEND